MLSDLLNLTTGAGILFLLGLLVLAFCGAALYFGRGRAGKAVGTVAIGAVVILALSVLVASTINGVPGTGNVVSSGNCSPVACTVNTLEKSAPALAPGETWNSVTNTLTVDLVYSSANNTFCVENVVRAAGCALASAGIINYVMLPLSLIRTDAVNTTASFPLTISTIPTAASIGSSPTTYSVVGYTAATSSSPGVWQEFFDQGTTSNLKPTVSAPSVSSNVQTCGLPVPSFGSKSVILHESLGGSNSTSAPFAFAQALTNYTAYNEVITIGNSIPTTITESFILIGWTSH